jgi:hypothetical protein
MVNRKENEMAYDGDRITERALRDAMQKIVQHAHAPQGAAGRMTKEELMKYIDVLEEAWRDVDWTIYYP